MTHFGTTNGLTKDEILALRTTDGVELWRDDVSDLTHEESLEARPGRLAAGKPVVIDDIIIFYLARDWTVGYSLGTGKRKWTHRKLGGTQTSTAHNGKYHALMGQDYVVLDPETGAEIRRVRLDSALPQAKMMFLGPPILVTDECVWLGSHRGFIFAFTHEGKYIWGFRPKGAAWTFHGSFRILGRRLYYTDGHRTYCFEEKPGRRPAARQAKRAMPPRVKRTV
jgi:outer membrane protein assembly factor BamB